MLLTTICWLTKPTYQKLLPWGNYDWSKKLLMDYWAPEDGLSVSLSPKKAELIKTKNVFHIDKQMHRIHQKLVTLW